MAQDDDRRTVIGPGSNIQFTVLIVIVGAVACGGVWIGKSQTEFDTLKTLVYEVRTDVKLLADQVRSLPHGREQSPRQF